MLEKKKGSYVFYLPKNTQTLAHVGKDMNMCVGAYARQAKEKICTIVLLDVAGEHKVCMELRENRVVQVKKYGNALVWPKYPEWNVINQWMIDNQLDTSRCKDFHGPINERRKITNY